MSLPHVSECLEKYRYATAVEQPSKLIRGELLAVLIDGHGLRAIDIARATAERPGDISQMYAVAKAFPRKLRPAGALTTICCWRPGWCESFPGWG